MNKESKFILGLKEPRYFTIAERHQIINEYLSEKCTKKEIWQKYTGEVEDHGHLLRWMRQLGYDDGLSKRKINFAAMKKDNNLKVAKEDSYETLQLKKRIAELEAQLKDAEMKAIAFSTMVDIAEREFKIPIRKKLNTKP